jgi:hypothetical protein
LKHDENYIPDVINKLFAKRNKTEKKAKKSEYIIAIVVNIVLLYIFNNLLNWHIYFITNALNEVLWIINLAIIATIVGNILLLAYNPEWFRHVMKIILNIVAVIAVYNIFIVFPFNFNSFLIDWSVIIALIFVMVGITIATIVEFFFLIMGRFK